MNCDISLDIFTEGRMMQLKNKPPFPVSFVSVSLLSSHDGGAWTACFSDSMNLL